MIPHIAVTVCLVDCYTCQHNESIAVHVDWLAKLPRQALNLALALERAPDVKMFFKIPGRFKIETPIGTYNPDWAVYLTRNGEEKLYFILEAKGNTNLLKLPPEP